jgi:hypothetical protein
LKVRSYHACGLKAGHGTNYAGPAPRALDYSKVEVSPDDGQLIVDMSRKVGQDFRLTV